MQNQSTKRVTFLTGTRADFGKLKPLMLKLEEDPDFEVHVFVTGMHMFAKYGYTCAEVEKAGFKRLYKYVNQNVDDAMDHTLSKTITGLSDYVREVTPDLLIIHGDRIETLAGAAVGALNNILTGHIEGGEVSGTVDELIRHAVSKLSHIHFVANDAAKSRLCQLGESEETIHVIGSPDIDVMNSPDLPSLEKARQRYDIEFGNYAIMMFHPVTTEHDDIRRQVRELVDAVVASEKNYVVIYPNNDHGAAVIFEEYNRLLDNPRFRIYPSIRFEYFLTLLRHCDFIVGNSSAGVREAPHFGVPAINIGSRQNNRVSCSTVLNVPPVCKDIQAALNSAPGLERSPQVLFGNGDSVTRFYGILKKAEFWKSGTQKHFVDQIIK